MKTARRVALAIAASLYAMAAFNETAAQTPTDADTPYDSKFGKSLSEIDVSLDFNNASIEEGLSYLKVKSKELDSDHKGVNFLIQPEASKSTKTVTLALTNVPLGVALKYVCELANVKAEVKVDAIHIVANSKEGGDVLDPKFTPKRPTWLTPNKRLRSIIIDKVNFNKLDIVTALQFLAQKSKEFDPDKAHVLDPNFLGVNFVLGNFSPDDHVHREISMTLENVSLLDLLNEIAAQTNLKYSIEDYAVYFHP